MLSYEPLRTDKQLRTAAGSTGSACWSLRAAGRPQGKPGTMLPRCTGWQMSIASTRHGYKGKPCQTSVQNARLLMSTTTVTEARMPCPHNDKSENRSRCAHRTRAFACSTCYTQDRPICSSSSFKTPAVSSLYTLPGRLIHSQRVLGQRKAICRPIHCTGSCAFCGHLPQTPRSQMLSLDNRLTFLALASTPVPLHATRSARLHIAAVHPAVLLRSIQSHMMRMHIAHLHAHPIACQRNHCAPSRASQHSCARVTPSNGHRGRARERHFAQDGHSSAGASRT